jgi:hypothetical protein
MAPWWKAPFITGLLRCSIVSPRVETRFIIIWQNTWLKHANGFKGRM